MTIDVRKAGQEGPGELLAVVQETTLGIGTVLVLRDQRLYVTSQCVDFSTGRSTCWVLPIREEAIGNTGSAPVLGSWE